MPEPAPDQPIHPYFRRRFAAYVVLFSLHCLATITLLVRPAASVDRPDALDVAIVAFLIVNLVPLFRLHLAADMFVQLWIMRHNGD